MFDNILKINVTDNNKSEKLTKLKNKEGKDNIDNIIKR
jgi:hypothetical protein